MVKKILTAIQQGDFIHKVLKKFGICFLYNKNTLAKYEIDYMYDKLKLEYKDFIDRGVVTSETSVLSNKVWICWFQGFQNAPNLVKACLNSVRTMLPNKEIILLSDDNISDYISLPNYIIEKRKKGIIPLAQYSDLVRIALLAKYGGTWIDATVLCTGDSMLNEIIKLPLFCFKEFDLTRSDYLRIVASNWFISAWSNQKIILLTRDLLYEYWSRENYLKHYFIFHIFFAMACHKYIDEWNNVPAFNNHSTHTMQFELENKFNEQRWQELIRISDIHKLNHHMPYPGEGTIYDYIVKHFC